MKADDHFWQITRLIRKAEAFDVLVDLLRDIASIDEQLKQIVRAGATKKSVMRAQLMAERGAIEAVLQRHIARWS